MNKEASQVAANVEQQLAQTSEQTKGMAGRAGLSGTVVLDANPGTALIWLKIDLILR